MSSLTSGEGLREHLGGERGLGARARGGAVLVLQVMRVRVVVLLAQHVPPAAVQEAVQDVRRDDVRQGERLLRLEARLQAQRGARQHGAHGGGAGSRGAGEPGSGGLEENKSSRGRKVSKIFVEEKLHSFCLNTSVKV